MRLITTTLVELTPEDRAFMTQWRGQREMAVVARRIGVAHSTLAYWERGERRPSLEMYATWVEALRQLDAAEKAAA